MTSPIVKTGHSTLRLDEDGKGNLPANPLSIFHIGKRFAFIFTEAGAFSRFQGKTAIRTKRLKVNSFHQFGISSFD